MVVLAEMVNLLSGGSHEGEETQFFNLDSSRDRIEAISGKEDGNTWPGYT